MVNSIAMASSINVLLDSLQDKIDLIHLNLAYLSLLLFLWGFIFFIWYQNRSIEHK